MGRSIAELEKMANRKTREFDKIYLKVPEHKRKQAYRIFIMVAEGKLSYEQGLKELRKLARS